MKITKRALEKINTVSGRIKLAGALNCTEQWIIKLIAANKNNGPLTTASALVVFRAETKLSDDQILEMPKVKA
jgi:hypothetical protein